MVVCVEEEENTGTMHPIEYIMLATGVIVALLGVAALVALAKSH
jgi:hypothetical protein